MAQGYSPLNDGSTDYTNQVSGATTPKTAKGGGKKGYIGGQVGPALATQPQDLANVLRAQRGMTGPNRGGKYANFAHEQYGKALALLAQLGPDLLGSTLEDLINQAASSINSGAGLQGMMQSAGTKAMGSFDPTQGDSQAAMDRALFIQKALGYGAGQWEQSQNNLAYDTLDSDQTNYDVSGKTNFFVDNPIDKTDYWKRLVAMAGQR